MGSPIDRSIAPADRRPESKATSPVGNPPGLFVWFDVAEKMRPVAQ
jgi:hypothetical protein